MHSVGEVRFAREMCCGAYDAPFGNSIFTYKRAVEGASPYIYAMKQMAIQC